MKQLTPVEALMIMDEMWSWFEKHSNKKNKGDWIELNLKYNDMVCECPMCEYGAQFTGSICEHCLIDWGNDDEFTPCCNHKSFFVKWEHACTNKTRKKYAGKVAQLARDKLEEVTK